MRLASFIRENIAPIVADWESFAITLDPSGARTESLVIRDHIQEILEFIVADIETTQTDGEQVEKSRGEKPEQHYPSAAEVHASLRYDGGFNMEQMVSEYRALRTSVVRLWKASGIALNMPDFDDLTRFNESIDQALKESISDYSKKLELSRNLFLGILSHDLRNPLGAVSMSAELTMKIGELSGRQLMLQSQIVESASRASEIVGNLLDLTRARLGSGLPIIRHVMDMGFVSRLIVDEMRAIHPHQEFLLNVSGDVSGLWDKARIGQVFSNLIGNAVQYGFRTTPVAIRVEGAPNEVVLSVHNEGVPIGADALPTLFNALTRAQPNDDTKSRPLSGNLGLGLFIVKEIITAHGGTISVSSSEKDGTWFRARFPRTDKVVDIKSKTLGTKPDSAAQLSDRVPV
ncbi:HAMP domain-containing sensor histidine kinase [Asticcacaulis sp. 201]|uniref:sensor histidine kinase n=1 Tax=Asticcacaulis sp. 201 TaxID=3028787 RepID=UPI0029165BE2|nr:HAMP domain-containing sensor histidine kinase [Asticcacaulis sp. 201]MDV6330972.1 HAMP domain-containing sensor histidine kinase [Asticcacaulis sp. 201]